MAKMKSTKKYYFSVEGETEQWYLKWLQDRINETEEAKIKVSFDCPVQKNPLKRAKSMVITGKTEVWHISDYERDEPIHVKQFMETMDNMKAAKGLGKQISYQFGYSNLTFDLWIILHKADCNGTIAHRKNYLAPLNRAFGEHFENMDEYKHEANFKRCLGKLQLANVIEAVNRAKTIMQKNKDNGYVLQQYKGYRYYKENPSLAIWEAIAKEGLDNIKDEEDKKAVKKLQKQLDKINESIDALNYVKASLNSVNGELRDMTANDEDMTITFSSSDTSVEELLENLELTYATAKGNMHIGGDGRNNQVYLASWIAKQKLEKSKERVTIFAIEEPEAHLHPHQQRQLSKYLASSFNEQIFITTHSPQIATEFLPNRIVSLYKDKNISKVAQGGRRSL